MADPKTANELMEKINRQYRWFTGESTPPPKLDREGLARLKKQIAEDSKTIKAK